MSDHAHRNPAAAARAELAAAGIIVAPAGAAAARRRRAAATFGRDRTRAIRRRVRATIRAEQPPGDASHHTAA